MLSIENLVASYGTGAGRVRALDGVSLRVEPGARVGVVGESGCGKSTLALSVLRLLDEPAGRVESGRVVLDGIDLMALSEREMCGVRGKHISMVFQEPMSSLNPLLTVGSQVAEALTAHERTSGKAARKAVVEMFERVGMAGADARYDHYPHQLSGGMRQRVMIAMGLICRPRVLLADEPTTALDVTTQAEILDLLRRLQEQTASSVVLITHDLGVVASFVQHVVVMYAGKVVEQAPVQELFASPAHPYTQALLDSLPNVNTTLNRLRAIPGRVPDLRSLPSGCRFRDRCERANDACAQEPELRELSGARRVRCHRALGVVS